MKTINTRSENWNNFWEKSPETAAKPSWSKLRIMSILSRYLKPGAKVIDAGCGSGFFSGFFAASGAEVLALDYSEKALDLCRARCPENVTTAKFDLLQQSISSSFGSDFDLIFSDGLLEHFPFEQQKAILSNFSEALNQNGMAVTFVPNLFSPWQLLRPFLMPGIEEKAFTLKKLIRLNELVNMKVCEANGINVIPAGFSPDRLFGKWFGMLLYTISMANRQ